MCGAGVLPARMAAEARRQGWRVIAFAFGDATGVAGHAARTIPSRITDVGAVLAGLRREGVSAALFCGKFWMRDVLTAGEPDASAAGIAARARSLADADLARVVLATLGEMGITVLDQRAFIGDWLAGSGCWSAREPTPEESEDVRRGIAVVRRLAESRIGQTVVLKRGVPTAVEAIEGTTEAIRRGTALAGPGAVVVKGVAPDHDYRFDTPTIGPETLEAAAAGGASVVAVEAGRVLILEKDVTVRIADRASIALVSVDAADA